MYSKYSKQQQQQAKIRYRVIQLRTLTVNVEFLAPIENNQVNFHFRSLCTTKCIQLYNMTCYPVPRETDFVYRVSHFQVLELEQRRLLRHLQRIVV